MDIKNFKHKITVKVRFNEVDMLGVCNNSVYITYFEEGRLDYLKKLKMIPKTGVFSDGDLYFIVRNEVNYRSHAIYGDELNIYSRISFIKNSSFGFEHIVENKKTKEIIADGKGVIVRVDSTTHKSIPLKDNFVKKIKAFEKQIKILK